MKKRTIYITLFLIFIIGVISLIGTFAIDSSITEGNSSKADYLFNITLGDRTNREIVIPSYDSKIVDIKISNPNEFNMSYLLYLEGVNSNLSIINISDNESSGVLNSKTNTLIKVFIQNNSSSDITTSIKDIVGFENEKLSLPSNNTSINKGTYYKVIVKSNNNTYGKVKSNIKLSTKNGTVKYNIVPNTGYKYKSTTCDGTVVDNILTISNITSNISCEVVFEPKDITVSLDLAGGKAETTYTETKEHTYPVLYNGTYQLEVWGAQGSGYLDMIGGYGGYSVGIIQLASEQKLYVNVGGSTGNSTGGYNGGGNGASSGWGDGTVDKYGGGGGATHISTKSGLLSSLGNYKDTILIVAGGGGGSFYHSEAYKIVGGHAGGYIGNNGNVYKSSCATNEDNPATGGTQTTGGLGNNGDTNNKGIFGQGGTGTGLFTGGGGGFYGGGGTHNVGCTAEGAAGGSGYIDNSLLTNKYMYCYNCTTSDATDTKTYTTTNTSSTPISNYAKSGNGAAKITLVDNANYKVTYNTKYGTLPTPTKDGYTFGGWYTGENGTGTKVDENTVLTNANNHTLYAKWDKNVVVTYNYRNNIYNQDTSVWNYNAKSYVDNNYSYNGTTAVHVIASDTAYTGVAIPLNSDKKQNTNYILSVKAYRVIDFSGNLRVYSATFDSSGNILNYNHAINITTSNSTLNTWKEYSYSFNSLNYTGWELIYIDYDTVNQGSVYVSDIRLDEYESKSIQRGEKYGTMPTPTRSGYTFAGWYTEPNGGGTRVTSDTILTNTNDHTLYARYTKNTYYITYDANGGTGAPSTQAFLYNSGAKISTIVPTKPGYTFLYWTYQGVVFNPGDAVPSGWGSFALTANWGANDTTPPTCSLSASGSNITASASDNVGLSYQGWDSSYSGTSITSKDISAGTHTYYVKDTAGNTNTCSINISGLVEKDIPYTETCAAYANYGYKASGQCTCRSKNKVNGSYKTTIVGCVVSGSSAVCSCGGTTPIVSSNGCSVTKYVTSYYCPGNGTVSGSTCIYTKYKITYVCPDGYSGVSGNSNFCYKY